MKNSFKLLFLILIITFFFSISSTGNIDQVKASACNNALPASQDYDGDGVPNNLDNCQIDRGALNDTGCPPAGSLTTYFNNNKTAQDTDGDKILNQYDNCPNTPGWYSSCGCSLSATFASVPTATPIPTSTPTPIPTSTPVPTSVSNPTPTPTNSNSTSPTAIPSVVPSNVTPTNNTQPTTVITPSSAITLTNTPIPTVNLPTTQIENNDYRIGVLLLSIICLLLVTVIILAAGFANRKNLLTRYKQIVSSRNRID